MLEYYAKGHQFHYNLGDYPIPDEHGCYLPLGWCSTDEADVFCRIVQPFIVKERFDTPEVPYEKMKEAWDSYCMLIEKGKI